MDAIPSSSSIETPVQDLSGEKETNEKTRIFQKMKYLVEILRGS